MLTLTLHSLEKIDEVFEGPFFAAYRTSKRVQEEEKIVSDSE